MAIPWKLRRGGSDFVDVKKGLYSSYYDHSVIGVRDQEKWERVWAEYLGRQPSQPLPEVDFRVNMVIAAFRGVFGTAGFDTTIKRVIDARFWGGRFRWVVIGEHDPWGAVRQDTTAPYHIISLPKSDLPVRPFFYRALF